MSITIIEPGILDTVQDLGRKGRASLGINPGGAMDRIAATIANYLVGNNADAPVIEMHFPAPVIQFNNTTLMAICGGDFQPVLDEVALPLHTPLLIGQGATLRFTKLKKGARAYLAVAGSFDLQPWLGSYATNLKAGAGGHEGRRLLGGDVLYFESRNFFGPGVHLSDAASVASHSSTSGSLPGRPARIHPMPWQATMTGLYGSDELRVVAGNEYPLLSDCSATILEGNTFIISHQSDRMGYRMNGSPLQLAQQKEMISSAVTSGTIQLLPNGQLIILMADHQTTGGYPRLAHLISADIPRLAQMQPNQSVRFRMVTLEEAEAALLEQDRNLQQVKNACGLRMEQYLQQHAPH